MVGGASLEDTIPHSPFPISTLKHLHLISTQVYEKFLIFYNYSKLIDKLIDRMGVLRWERDGFSLFLCYLLLLVCSCMLLLLLLLLLLLMATPSPVELLLGGHRPPATGHPSQRHPGIRIIPKSTRLFTSGYLSPTVFDHRSHQHVQVSPCDRQFIHGRSRHSLNQSYSYP